MPTPTFLRDLASDVLNGRTSPISAILALRLVEQAEALEGAAVKEEPVVKKERLFWSKADKGDALFIGVEGCDVLNSHYTALTTAAHSFELEGKGNLLRVNACSLEEAAGRIFEWAIEDGYDVAPCPADLLPPKKVALVWVEHGGYHLCLPGDLDYMKAPYSYWDSPMGYAQSYDDLGAKSRQRVDVQSEEAGVKLIVEWATADGYNVPAIPIDFLAEPTKVEPASKEEEPVIKPVGSDLDQLFAAFKAYLATPAGRPYKYYCIELFDDESGEVARSGERLIEWSTIKEGVANIKALLDKE